MFVRLISYFLPCAGGGNLFNLELGEDHTIVGILTFMSGKNSSLGLSEPRKAEFLIFLYL